MPSPHNIVHIELSASDPRKSSDFYKNVFGWKIDIDPRFDYHQFTPETPPAGAFVQTDNETYKAGDVVIYIATEDIDDSLAKVEAQGGKTLLPKTEIPGVGHYAFFADPTGNRMGLFSGGPPSVT